MPILNYTTSIAAEKSIMEIQKILVKHGATKIVTDYEGELPSAVSFWLMMDDKPIAFSLPANWMGVLKAMNKDPKVPGRLKTNDQALKVSWRIVKDWIEAQTAIVQAGLADMAEVFLPYAVTKNGSTLYREIRETGKTQLLLSE